jgi:hypothetical protein
MVVTLSLQNQFRSSQPGRGTNMRWRDPELEEFLIMASIFVMVSCVLYILKGII